MPESYKPVPSSVFDEAFIKQLAVALSAEIEHKLKTVAVQWPELMSIETAARYLDRTPDGIRHLIEAEVLPPCRIDRRVQLRRVDLDRVAETNTSFPGDRMSRHG